MKTILALLLALAGLTLNAAPKFLPLPGTPESTKKKLADEIELWKNIIKIGKFEAN